MDKAISPWSVPVTLEEIPETGLHREIEAPAEARAAIAKLAGLRELPRCRPPSIWRAAARGRWSAAACRRASARPASSRLDPIENALDEPIEIVFAPAAAAAAAPASRPRRRSMRPTISRKPSIDGKLDLGALASEFLMLGIDPYPRKPGVEFAPPKVEDGGEHPFAALAALKKRSGSGAVLSPAATVERQPTTGLSAASQWLWSPA